MTAAGLTAAPHADLRYLRSAGLVLLAGTFWSIGGVLIRLIESADARQVVLWRSVFILLFVVAVVLVRNRGRLVAPFAAIGWNGALGGLCLAGAFVLFIESMTRTTVANALFILATQPFLTALLGRLILREHVRPATWLAMAVAGIGIGVMVGPELGTGSVLGSLMALGSAFCFALFSIALRRGRATDTSPSIAYAGLFSAIFCAGLLTLENGPSMLLVSHHDLLVCSVLGVVQIGFGMLAYTAGSRHLPAADLTILALGEVVLGPIWVWLVIHEVPSLTTLLGGALVIAATLVQALSGARRRREPTGFVG
ncbi:MAG: DMT family transporter [Geminicoccaceae bacterium]